MTVDVAKFRADFPEFADAAKYTPAQVQFYLDIAQGTVNPPMDGFIGERWGSKADFGTELFVAHNLALETQAQQMAARGQNPGQIMGPLSGGTVDKVSYQRQLQNILLPNAGHWNLSVYGLRYIQLVRIIGMGPLQISPCGAPGGASYPWAGPGVPPWQ